MNALHRALLFAIPSALAISACAPQAAAPPPRQEASPVAVATVAVRQHPSLGQMLTDPAGRTLYRFSRDTPGTSSCYDQCAAAWPPLLA